MYQVKKALKKCTTERTKDDNDLLENCKDLVQHVDLCEQNRVLAAAHQEIILDDTALLESKCKELSDAISNSKCCVIYTGAGISTSAKIPDYRGPSGLWTLLEQGVKVSMPDFSEVEPTYSHMALNSLMKQDLVKHIVSQNCDGLHVRSGLDRSKLSELHGNCFIEFCSECFQEYIRLFDVTEKSSFRKHSTGRFCKHCKKPITATDKNENEKHYPLRDSIIHFGEKLRNGYPYNWERALETIKEADLIICLGTSLKVLKHYACLWPKKKSSIFYIVNIQWTPKDKQAKLKINGYCDQVMKLIIENLQPQYPKLKVNEYSIKTDPIIKKAIKLTDDELKTTNKSNLTDHLNKTIKNEDSTDSSFSSRQSIGAEQETPKLAHSSNSWYTRSFKERKTSQKSNKAKRLS